MGRRPPLASGRLHSAGYRHGAFLCHTVLRDEIRSSSSRRQRIHCSGGNLGRMSYFLWIAGAILALAWFSRIVDAALGMPHVADIARPEWDRSPTTPAPRVSVIVPARNEEKHIGETLTRLLALDYSN